MTQNKTNRTPQRVFEPFLASRYPVSSKVVRETLLESEGTRSSRISSYGRAHYEEGITGIAPDFTMEARARWAAARDEISIERLFK